MPVDLVQRIDLDQIYPPFLERALELVARCRQRGYDYWAIRGFATFEAQDRLYAQGRTAPGAIVTDAPGGLSAHNYGIAIDFARDKDATRDGLQPDWDPRMYVALGDEARRLGLVWGGDFRKPDRPHVQWPGFVTGREIRPLRDAFLQTGIKGAWRLLDVCGPGPRL